MADLARHAGALDSRLIRRYNSVRILDAVRRHGPISRAGLARRARLEQRYDLCGIVYQSDAMADLLVLATQIAHADVPVLITGANGAGKEKLADIVQANSSCRDGP